MGFLLTYQDLILLPTFEERLEREKLEVEMENVWKNCTTIQ